MSASQQRQAEAKPRAHRVSFRLQELSGGAGRGPGGHHRGPPGGAGPGPAKRMFAGRPRSRSVPQFPHLGPGRTRGSGAGATSSPVSGQLAVARAQEPGQHRGAFPAQGDPGPDDSGSLRKRASRSAQARREAPPHPLQGGLAVGDLETAAAAHADSQAIYTNFRERSDELRLEWAGPGGRAL